ncbi:MAG: hypothetical protein AB4206_13315 [Xenococcaceae cyanobacterium]
MSKYNWRRSNSQVPVAWGNPRRLYGTSTTKTNVYSRSTLAANFDGREYNLRHSPSENLVIPLAQDRNSSQLAISTPP